jgi:serine/threonine-protein phosphatase 2B catalytic subunit
VTDPPLLLSPLDGTLQAIFILTEASKVLRNEPNLLEVDAPITGGSSPFRSPRVVLMCAYAPVCGDIHGQYVRILSRPLGRTVS